MKSGNLFFFYYILLIQNQKGLFADQLIYPDELGTLQQKEESVQEEIPSEDSSEEFSISDRFPSIGTVPINCGQDYVYYNGKCHKTHKRG